MTPEDGVETPGLLHAWTSALGASDWGALWRRLAWDGASPEIAEAYFKSLLRPGDSRWFPRIRRWLASSAPIADDDPPDDLPAPFADLWRRIATPAMRELANSLPEKVAAHYQAGPDRSGRFSNLCREIGDDLVSRLSAVAEPALWDEFNLRRTPSQIVLAHLRADESGTAAFPRTLYCGFLESLRGDGARSLAGKYPALARHLSTTLDHWLGYHVELLTRVYNDRTALIEHFRLPADAVLHAIAPNLSDPHSGGRTVAKLSFRSASEPGEDHLVAYKPKDLRLDCAFQGLLAELPPPTPSDRGLRSLVVLPRCGYGYMQWVPHHVCRSDSDLSAFYRNAGRLAALVHLLGGTDCHHENLISSGDCLFLIDAETLFEGVHGGNPGSSRSRTGLQLRIGDSVMRTGLLPQWSFVGRERVRRDVSALGIEPPSDPDRLTMGWIGLNSDGMIADEILAPANLPTSLPVGVGSGNRLADFADKFCDGFVSELTGVANDKSRWLADDGLLSRFKSCKRRFLPRPTWIYLWLRGELLKPSSLSSEAGQRLVLEQLAQSYLVSKVLPKNWPLFAREIADVDALDVPFFEQGIEDCDLELPDGARLDAVREVSGYDNARRKIEKLDSSEIDFEVRLARGAIAAKHLRAIHGPERLLSGRERQVDDEFSVDGRLAEEARAIGDLLVGASIQYGEGAVEWLGIDVAEDAEKSRYGPLGPSLYGGRAGIALFLAALANTDTAGADAYKRTAIAACSDLFDQLACRTPEDSYRWWRDQPLGLAGSGGIILTLLHLTELMPALRDAAEAGLAPLLEALDIDLLRADLQLDIVLGCAGLIGPMLRIGTPRALRLAQEAGDQLVRCQDDCGGWVLPGIGSTALTGFSHGASGIAAALARLYSVTGRPSHLDAAAKALRYERGTFDAAAKNWPDFREVHDPETPRFMLSWCHGAPGVALARLCLSATQLWDGLVEDELGSALESTASSDLGGDSVCCGRFGRAAILRLAASARGEPQWRDRAAVIERQALRAKRAAGEYSFLDILGLFTGLSGVGLALLDSIATPERRILPSILSAGLKPAASTPGRRDR
jgi:type 2 lantibiotic biosynthesis protein LanM